MSTNHHQTTTDTAVHIQTLTHTLRNHTTTLEQVATKRIRINPTHPNTPASSAPTPINLAAKDLINQIHALATMLAHAAGLRFHPRHIDTLSLLKGLDRTQPCAALAARDDAADVIRLLEQANARCARMVERERCSVLVGVCPQCGAGVWVDELTADPMWDCDLCGFPMDLRGVRQAHELRLLTSGAVGGAADLTDLLRLCGYGIRADRVRQWAARGKLHAIGSDDSGRALYLLGDVIRLYHAMPQSERLPYIPHTDEAQAVLLGQCAKQTGEILREGRRMA